jgi:hypothetical protein
MFPCRPKRLCTELGRMTRAKRRNKNTEEREGPSLPRNRSGTREAIASIANAISA